MSPFSRTFRRSSELSVPSLQLRVRPMIRLTFYLVRECFYFAESAAEEVEMEREGLRGPRTLAEQVEPTPLTRRGAEPPQAWRLATQCREAFVDGDFSTLHGHLLELVAQGPKGTATLSHVVEQLARWDGPAQAVDVLNQYVLSYGTRSFLPFLLRGEFFVKWAWDARTGATIEHVTARMFEEFQKRLCLAVKDLEAALGMGEHALIFAKYLQAGIGLQWPIERLASVFERAIAHPTGRCWDLWSVMLSASCEKWRGTHALMFTHAHRATRDAPPGHPLHALVASAHCERALQLTGDLATPHENATAIAEYFGREAVRNDILRAYELFNTPVQPSDDGADWEDEAKAHELFALTLWFLWRQQRSTTTLSEAAAREVGKTPTRFEDLSPAWHWLTRGLHGTRGFDRFNEDLNPAGSRRARMEE